MDGDCESEWTEGILNSDYKSEWTGKKIIYEKACFPFLYVPLCREISVYTGYNLMI